MAAIESLGKLKAREAVEPLIAILRENDKLLRVPDANGGIDLRETVRTAAADALGEIGDLRAVDPLIAAMRDADVVVGRHAIMALGQLKDRQAVEPLIAVLRKNIHESMNDVTSDVAAEAIRASA